MSVSPRDEVSFNSATKLGYKIGEERKRKKKKETPHISSILQTKFFRTFRNALALTNLFFPPDFRSNNAQTYKILLSLDTTKRTVVLLLFQQLKVSDIF